MFERRDLVRAGKRSLTVAALTAFTICLGQAAEKPAAKQLIELAHQKSGELADALRASLGDEKI